MKIHTRPEGTMPEPVLLLTVEGGPSGRAAQAPCVGSLTKVFCPWNPEQAALLPASKRDSLGETHLAVFLRDLLEHPDLRPILDAYVEDRGQRPYDPRMMTVLLLGTGDRTDQGTGVPMLLAARAGARAGGVPLGVCRA